MHVSARSLSFSNGFPREAGSFSALVGADLVRVDGLLARLLGAGLGVAAIAEYLGATREDVADEAAGQGLTITQAQRDAPLRLRKNGWSSCDHRALIVGWMGGAPVASIADIVGRSRSAIYGKRRRLGLAPRRESASRKPTASVSRSAARAAERPADAPPPAAPAEQSCPGGMWGASTPIIAPAPPAPISPESIAPAADWGDAEEMATGSAPPCATACDPAPEAVVSSEATALPKSIGASGPTIAPGAAPPAAPVAPAKQKKRCEVETILTREAEPGLFDAVEAFMETGLPAGIDINQNGGTRAYVISGLAILGGMSTKRVAEIAGFSPSQVSNHIYRLHLSSKDAQSSTFDPARLAESLLDATPVCDPKKKRLFFRRAGDPRRHCVVVEQDEARRVRKALKKQQQKEEKIRARHEEAIAAGLEVRRGVTLPRSAFLRRPELAA